MSRPPVTHVDRYLSREESDELFAELRGGVPWQDERVLVDGVWVSMGRLVCWVGGPDYEFFGATIRGMPWTPRLRSLRDRLAVDVGAHFNAVLLNQYRDGSDSVDWHADDESALGTQPIIASLSLGSTRRFVMRRIDGSGEIGWDLGHGSLIVMYGDSQSAWEHAVPPRDSAVGPRLNLTFRRYQR